MPPFPMPQAEASDGSDGIGFIAFWGNSPSVDLLGDDQYAVPPVARAVETSAEEPVESSAELAERADAEPFNVLISGGADLRHVLKTLARMNRKEDFKRPIHFYLHESHNEVLARHVLFLLLLTQRNMPCRERSEMFLSLYGNTLVREKDAEWVNDQVLELLNIITAQSSHPLASVLDLSSIKFKDRDELQEVFQCWRKSVPFDVESLRDQRLRGYFRARYEYKTNLLDWDYHNGIRNKCPIIHWQHFKEFGLSGVAFETRLASYSTPNRTVASYAEGKSKTKGTSILVRGFWGDIVNPPYMAFGVDCDPVDKARLFKRANEQFRENSVSISAFNVQRYLHEMETGVPMDLPAPTPKENVFPYESPLERLNKVEELPETDAEPALPPVMSRVKVSLIAGDLQETLRKVKFQKKFHRAFFGNLAVGTLFTEAGLMDEAGDHVSDPTIRIGTDPMRPLPEEAFGKKAGPIAGAMADGSVVVTDSFQYQCHFDGKTKLGYRRRVHEACHRLGWGLRRPRTSTPRLEPDMKDLRCREIDAQADTFLSFCPGQPAEPISAGELPDLTDDEPLEALDDEVPTDVSES